MSFAGGRYAVGALKADAARTEWEQMQAANAVARARSSAVTSGATGKALLGSPVMRDTHLVKRIWRRRPYSMP